MLKTRRLHRREKEKDRLYTALRALYEDGVRVCTGRRRRRAAETPASTAPVKRAPSRASNRLSLLDESNTQGTDPYNTSGR